MIELDRRIQNVLGGLHYYNENVGIFANVEIVKSDNMTIDCVLETKDKKTIILTNFKYFKKYLKNQKEKMKKYDVVYRIKNKRHFIFPWRRR